MVKKIMSKILAVALLAGVLAGCGGADPNGSASSASSESAISAVSSSSASQAAAAAGTSGAAQEPEVTPELTEAGPAPLTAVAVTPAPAEDEYVTVGSVYIRKEPKGDGEIRTALEPNTKVEVTGEEGDWYKILYDGETCYVLKELIEVKQGETQTPQAAADAGAEGKIVVIDPGHQTHGNSDQEPIGPGARETKAKVTGGCSGVVSGLAEYEFNLIVAQKLQAVLEQRGYTVIMTRTTNDVNISNSERAAIANDVNAAAFIRVHANSSENSSAHGAMTICQTSGNPYNGELYEESRALATYVLDSLVEATGCSKERVWETDTMSGINWCKVPTTIVECGYMSNPDEDSRLASSGYQDKIAQGIANGIDQFTGGSGAAEGSSAPSVTDSISG